MLQFQDRLANRAREIAGIMLGRRIEIPEELVESVRDYYQINLNTSAQALKAINELDELLETGFRGREATLVEELLVELDELEHQSDVSQVKLRALLFQMEDTLPPVNVIFLYRIIDRLGELADISQKVSGRLLLLIAK